MSSPATRAIETLNLAIPTTVPRIFVPELYNPKSKIVAEAFKKLGGHIANYTDEALLRELIHEAEGARAVILRFIWDNIPTSIENGTIVVMSHSVTANFLAFAFSGFSKTTRDICLLQNLGYCDRFRVCPNGTTEYVPLGS